MCPWEETLPKHVCCHVSIVSRYAGSPKRSLPKKNTGEIPRRHAQVGSSGTRADPTVWCRRHSEWWSVGRGMGNYADGPSWAQRSAKGHGTWGMSWGPSAISGENASCTAEAIVGGGVKDRIARVSTGMSKGIYMEGPCQVSPLQHARLLRFQSCSFLCADSCEAMLIVRYLQCPAGDTRPREACVASWNILKLLADGVACQHHLCHVVLAFFLFRQTATLVG